MKRTTLLFFAATALVLVVLNFLIWQKEHLLKHGTPMLLKLVPVDPRSLMQGDYMQLRYGIATKVGEQAPASGRLVVKTDEHNVASFVRVDRGEPLAPGERYLVYRSRDRNEVRLGAESFFFQEGHADRYERAQYGELRVAPSGASVLVGLRDEARRPLGEAIVPGDMPAPPRR